MLDSNTNLRLYVPITCSSACPVLEDPIVFTYKESSLNKNFFGFAKDVLMNFVSAEIVRISAKLSQSVLLAVQRKFLIITFLFGQRRQSIIYHYQIHGFKITM